MIHRTQNRYHLLLIKLLFDNFVADIDVQEERRKGQEIGKEIGAELKVITLVCTKMKKGCSIPVIADALEEDEAHIQEIYDVAIRYAPSMMQKRFLRSLPINLAVICEG